MRRSLSGLQSHALLIATLSFSVVSRSNAGQADQVILIDGPGLQRDPDLGESTKQATVMAVTW